MLLFDIGAIVFIAGALNFLFTFILPRYKRADANAVFGARALMFILTIVGPILMMVSYYVVEGNASLI